MANDPLSPVVRGQVLAISAAAWNEVLATARDHRQPRRPVGPGRQRQVSGVVEALALNSTGAALREFRPAAVTAAGGYDVTGDAGYDWQRKPLLTLGVPAAATDHIVVTLEAIPAGEIGRVAVAGAVLCDVHVNDAGHAFAAPATNTTALESAVSGPVRILHKGTGSSTRRCVVYLFSPGDGGAACADYPQMYKRVVGVDFATPKVHVRIVTIDADGCVSTGDVVCENGSTCTTGEKLKYWCIAGTCWKVYDGITPTSGTGPYDTPEECATACVDAWYCTEEYECVLVAAGDSPPAGYVSGPHAAEEDCAAACSLIPASGCCPDPGLPTTWTQTLSGGNGSVTMTYDGSTYWTGSKALGGCTVEWRFNKSTCAMEYRKAGGTWLPAACGAAEGAPCIACGPPVSAVSSWTYSASALGVPCSFGTITGTAGT